MDAAEDPASPGPCPGFTLGQFWKMCDAHMSDPVALGQGDVTQPFVYDRRYGFFLVPNGYHQGAMSLLLAFHHGLASGVEVASSLGLTYSAGSADHWLEKVPGTAFRSSQGSRVIAGRRGNLNALELRRMGAVRYVFTSES